MGSTPLQLFVSLALGFGGAAIVCKSCLCQSGADRTPVREAYNIPRDTDTYVHVAICRVSFRSRLHVYVFLCLSL